MKTIILVLFIWCSAVIAQPLEGPWEVLSSEEIRNPQVVARNDSVADLFYQAGNDVYHAAFALDIGLLYAGPDAFPSPPEGFSRSLDDALMAQEGWIALVSDESASAGGNRIVLGNNQVDQEREIDGVSHEYGMFWGPGYNFIPRLCPNLNEGFCTAWTASRTYWAGNFWEGIVNPVVRRYANFADNPMDLLPCSCWNSCNSDWVFTAPVTNDSAMIVYCTGYGFTLSATCHEPEFSGWGREYEVPMAPLAMLRTHGGRYFILRDQGNNYYGSFDARLFEFDTAGTVTEVLTLNDDPLCAASDPDFGIAWLARFGQGLVLYRVDTTGAEVHPAGVVHWPDADHEIVEAALAISDNGLLVAAWTERELPEETPTILRIASVGWDTFLGTEEFRIGPLPSSFSLSAYPNPFNAQTRLAYTVPKSGRVKLAVCDVLGRRVAVLLDETVQAGEHSIIWDGSNAGTGVYFARLRTAGSTVTRKLLLLK